MKYRLRQRPDVPASLSPYRVMDESGKELEWVNRFLDVQRTRGLCELSLRSYGTTLLHFVRWWSQQPGVDVSQFRAQQFTESTLVDYVRSQLDERPKPGPRNIDNRSSMIRRLFRFYFGEEMPHGPYRLKQTRLRRPEWGYNGPGRGAVVADPHLKVPQRVVEPLSREQVARFWASFDTARDLAIVGLMLLNGLRSREVLDLHLEDLLFSEAQIRVRGKGAKIRLMPVPPETVRMLRSYLQTERPITGFPHLFVSWKGVARGKPMTPAGLRSLFRHHREESGVPRGNPHRLRHTFGADMIRAGVSLPALMRLMGHTRIQTTLLYIQLSPQDVYAEYAQAVSHRAAAAKVAGG